MNEAMKRALRRGLLATLLLTSLSALAQGYEACGDLHNAYGPIDYRKATPDQKELVERTHFTPQVESLQHGNAGYLAGDIDYTLRVFPNHPRALFAMMKLFERKDGVKPRGSHYTMDCWFDRAIRFQPDDGQVHLLYGIFLSRHSKTKQAIEQLEQASKLLGDEDGNAHYNLGLAYVAVKQYDKALIHAQKAYQLGFNLPGLRDKLKRVGKWKDPEPPAPPAPVATEPTATEPSSKEPPAATEPLAPSEMPSSTPPDPNASVGSTSH